MNKTILAEDQNILLTARLTSGIIVITQTDGINENSLYLTPDDAQKVVAYLSGAGMKNFH
jgi:hypothetical protein